MRIANAKRANGMRQRKKQQRWAVGAETRGATGSVSVSAGRAIVTQPNLNFAVVLIGLAELAVLSPLPLVSLGGRALAAAPSRSAWQLVSTARAQWSARCGEWREGEWMAVSAPTSGSVRAVVCAVVCVHLCAFLFGRVRASRSQTECLRAAAATPHHRRHAMQCDALVGPVSQSIRQLVG